MFTREFLTEIPKTDLHLHLDGSLRINTLIELAKEQGVELPDYTEEGLKEKVFKKSYKDLPDYLRGFGLTCSVLRKPEALERVAYELACDNYDENVYYFEVRFAPQLHAGCTEDDMSISDVLRAVHKGLEKAKTEYNAKRADALASRMDDGIPPMPEYDYGIIVCAMRFFLPVFSPYFRAFWELHKHEKPARVHGLASMALVQAAVKIRDEEGMPIVALDIAGAERSFPAEQHKEAYAYAHSHFMNKTVHAGEDFGPESISQAVRDLHAERIGHGYHIFSHEEVSKKENPELFVEKLSQFVADRRLLLEVCLTSNLQTMPKLNNDIKNHQFAKMLEEKLSVSICTDNRLVSRTTVTDEYEIACSNFKINTKVLKDIVVAGFKRSFFAGKYIEKRSYVRSVMNYFDYVCRKYEIKAEE
eukprot:TRINITY_DN776088_c0_g1_i1.p1 TRINITY_DN776088_c0_g1~~TRINITY_DN776088_c0_g1_i1.p1  ORF type:complete len:417 (-),score=122.79 TRINITY_DN776088_c0_g1_i1:274-1524(-)